MPLPAHAGMLLPPPALARQPPALAFAHLSPAAPAAAGRPEDKPAPTGRARFFMRDSFACDMAAPGGCVRMHARVCLRTARLGRHRCAVAAGGPLWDGPSSGSMTLGQP